MGEPLIQAQNISVKMGGRQILDHIDLAIEAKEIVTIVGPNGSGKSTLLRTLIGAITPDHGKIRRKSGLTIGYVPQKLHLDPTLPLTVGRFLNYPEHMISQRSIWHWSVPEYPGGRPMQ